MNFLICAVSESVKGVNFKSLISFSYPWKTCVSLSQDLSLVTKNFNKNTPYPKWKETIRCLTYCAVLTSVYSVLILAHSGV